MGKSRENRWKDRRSSEDYDKRNTFGGERNDRNRQDNDRRNNRNYDSFRNEDLD
jgi:hypothetical protein